MAAADALERQPAALEGPVFSDGLVSIGRASWGIPTLGRKGGRNVLLIKPNEKEKYFFHGITFLYGTQALAPAVARGQEGDYFKIPAFSANCR